MFQKLGRAHSSNTVYNTSPPNTRIWEHHLGTHYNGTKHQIDRDQHIATRLVRGFDEISYEERLRRLKLPSLQYRRKRGDMIQTYKILREIDRIDPAVFFKCLPSQVTRGHSFKIHKQQVHRQVRSQSYSI